jgi:hypothetical protein
MPGAHHFHFCTCRGCLYIRVGSWSRGLNEQLPASPTASLPRGAGSAPPLIPVPFPPSLGINLACPVLSVPPFIFESPHLRSRSIAEHLLFPPSSLLLLHASCCTQDQLVYSSHFVFLSFVALVVVGANGVVFFYKVVLI